ncbi:hypothetical protein OsI_03965 [Oryza sativa Indica Group]|uniref:Uncharacterized protein n=2 Tax=Oryza sativa TaxID=4530 RepID=B9FEF9_ORYSJ|nr:hypothetical protein OsI_03965 [Oryza sativa Indica Group]EEE60742.1 hypothetical protein OsJ_14282 [Oryza sativa Japonica Group]
MAARSQTLQGLDILQNGVQNQEIDIPRNDQYVEEQNISNENWRTNCYEYLPNTVDESQWPTLVSYWYSKDSKKISDRNQENALKHPHTLGRKSFTRKRKELEVNEVEVDRETFFDECHKTKDGRYVTDATQEKMSANKLLSIDMPCHVIMQTSKNSHHWNGVMSNDRRTPSLSCHFISDTCNLYNLTPRRTTVAQVKTSVPRALPNLSVIATK